MELPEAGRKGGPRGQGHRWREVKQVLQTSPLGSAAGVASPAPVAGPAEVSVEAAGTSLGLSVAAPAVLYGEVRLPELGPELLELRPKPEAAAVSILREAGVVTQSKDMTFSTTTTSGEAASSSNSMSSIGKEGSALADRPTRV